MLALIERTQKNDRFNIIIPNSNKQTTCEFEKIKEIIPKDYLITFRGKFTTEEEYQIRKSLQGYKIKFMGNGIDVDSSKENINGKSLDELLNSNNFTQ